MPPRPAFLRVPTTAQVVPGAHVHIVLKHDQPTGRTVQGIVQAVLTRGNHPRGIKVRLVDGRVGRVQAMAEGKPGEATEAVTNPGLGALPGRAPALATPAAPAAPAAARPVYHEYSGPTDIRNEEVPLEQIGLDAYIRPPKLKQKKRNRGGAGGGEQGAAKTADGVAPTGAAAAAPAATVAACQQPLPGESQSCPVCGQFEGDAAAVAHHVASHFDEA